MLNITQSHAVRVLVDFDRSVEEGNNAGEYLFVNTYITSENFPTQEYGVYTKDIEILVFDVRTNPFVVAAEFCDAVRRPIGLAGLHAIGQHCRNLPYKLPIVAPNALWQTPWGFKTVAYLAGRGLNLTIADAWWESGTGFAFERISEQQTLTTRP